MIGITNAHGGGASAEAYAYIKVYYNGGATCTCSDGSTTLTAPATTAGEIVSFVFGVPNSGTWTITATDSEEIVTRTVAISSQYQITTIYAFYTIVWGNGLSASDWTFAGKAYSSSTGTAKTPTYSSSGGVLSVSEGNGGSSVNGGIAYHTSSINVSYYQTLQLTGTISATDVADDGCGLCIWSSVPSYITSSTIAHLDTGRSQTLTNPSIDVSSISQSVLIGIKLLSRSSSSYGQSSASITKLVLK